MTDLLDQPSIDLPARVPHLLAGLAVPLSSESLGMLAQALSFDPARRPRSASSFAAPLVRDLQHGS